MNEVSAGTLRMALLHLAPEPGDVAGNQKAIERGICRAAGAGARWVLTPELATSGYPSPNKRAPVGLVHSRIFGWILFSPNRGKWTNIALGLPERDLHRRAQHALGAGTEWCTCRHRTATLNTVSEFGPRQKQRSSRRG